MTEPTNADRAARGGNALDTYRFSPGMETERQSALGDLLADLMHYAGQEDLDFESALRTAEMHYAEELAEEGEDDDDEDVRPDTDPENIYGSPSIQQSIEESRK